jgi:hypothetical protein
LSLPAIQAFLEESSSDVLLLLDTCETVLSGTVSGGSTVMELLASSGFNVKGKNRSRGFTRSLIEELIGRVTGPPFSTAELHVALLRWMQTRPPDDVERNPPPLYMVLTKPSRLRQSIFLSPIPKALSSIDTDERPGPAESSASGATAFSDTSSYSSRVLVSIKLKDGLEEKLDLDAWKEWLRSMPPEAKNVKIRAAISSP